MNQRKLEGVDWTILSSLDECPRKCQYRFIYQIVRRKPSLAAEFGKAYHAGVGAYYKEARNLDAGLAAFEQSWLPFDGAEGEDLYTMARGKELVTAYTERYKDETWKWHAGEQPFAIDVPGAPYLFLGIIDGVGEETGITRTNRFGPNPDRDLTAGVTREDVERKLGKPVEASTLAESGKAREWGVGWRV